MEHKSSIISFKINTICKTQWEKNVNEMHEFIAENINYIKVAVIFEHSDMHQRKIQKLLQLPPQKDPHIQDFLGAFSQTGNSPCAPHIVTAGGKFNIWKNTFPIT